MDTGWNLKRTGRTRLVSWLVMALLVAVVTAHQTRAQLPEGLSPEVAERFMAMSTSQQMAIARQYGLSLNQLKEQANLALAPEVPDVNSAPGLPQMGLGDRGVPLMPYEAPGDPAILAEGELLLISRTRIRTSYNDLALIFLTAKCRPLHRPMTLLFPVTIGLVWVTNCASISMAAKNGTSLRE